MFHPRDRSGLERLSIHDRSVELVCPLVGEDGALARVEKRIVLQDTNRGFDRVETGTAALENVVTGLE